LLELSEETDIVSFVLSDGKRQEKTRVSRLLTLEEFFGHYKKKLPAGAMEANSLETVKLHMSHFLRHLGKRFAVQSLAMAHLQAYVDARSHEKGHRNRPISPTTIKKEMASFSGVWTWAVQMGLVKGVFPNRGLKYPKTTEKPPFQTWTEIEIQIERGGL